MFDQMKWKDRYRRIHKFKGGMMEKLNQIGNDDMYRSALSNPGPTGAGAVIYLDGYDANPILLIKGVNPISIITRYR